MNLSKHRKVYCLVFLFLIFVLIPNKAISQESNKEKYNIEFVAAPLVTSNPNFGTGGGAMGMMLFDMDPEDEELQSSSVGVTGLYTDRTSHLLALGGSLFPDKYYRFKSGIADGRIRSELDLSTISGTADFTTGFNAVFIEGLYRFFPNLFGGLRSTVVWRSYSADNRAGGDYLQIVDAEDGVSASLGPILSYDTRDNRFFPFSGLYSEISCLFFPSSFGNDVSYHVFEGFINGYKQYRPNHVLAARLSGRFTPDQTPYSGLSTLGKQSDLRGYVAGEHIANNLVSAQIEYRWHFYEKWALVGFIGEALLFNSGDIDSDSFYFSGGGGIRYRLSDERRVNFRVDVAWGEGNSDGFYVGMSEAF